MSDMSDISGGSGAGCQHGRLMAPQQKTDSISKSSVHFVGVSFASTNDLEME